MIGASLLSISRGHSIANFSPSTMQFFMCILCGRVFSWQSGLTRHCRSSHAHLQRNSSSHSASNRLDSILADDIPQYDDDRLNQSPETEIFPKAGTPFDDNILVQSFEHDDWDPLAPFAIPNNGSFLVLLGRPIEVKWNSTTSSTEDLLYPMPMPKTLTCSLNTSQTWQKRTDWYEDGSRVLLILKKKLHCSGIGTLLPQYNLA